MVIVLLGPPGSGKTYLGHLLSDSVGFSFFEAERDLVSTYGFRETFLKQKAAALAAIEQDIRRRALSSPVPLVIESTGLSDRPALERLARDFAVVFVKVVAPRSVCIERVRTREPGRNLSNDPEAAGELYDYWAQESLPRYEYALEVQNLDGASEEAVKQIAALAGGTQ